MMKVFISHNPFTVKTELKINDRLKKDSFTEAYYINHHLFKKDNEDFIQKDRLKARLQFWVDELPKYLAEEANGDEIEMTFQGVEADWIDIQGTLENAKNKYEKFKLKSAPIWQALSEARLNQIEQLIQEALVHPDFKEELNAPEIKEKLAEALKKDFDVYVSATMSAGKSTLINAMLGVDLLPSANEATTATIAKIIDDKSQPNEQFIGRRIYTQNNELKYGNEQIVNKQILTQWNKTEGTKEILLKGNIQSVKAHKNVQLVITDTPGPNNSEDDSHQETTLRFIKDTKRNPLMIYILNATQLATNDDKFVLTTIAKTMAQNKGDKQVQDRFIFVVNKMDEIDPEKDGELEGILERITAYLQNCGIESPRVYPVSANFARLLRAEGNPNYMITTREKGDLMGKKYIFEEIDKMDLTQYMPLSDSLRKKIKDQSLPMLLERSGLPALEMVIEDYINRYAIPERVNYAYQALSEAINIKKNENELVQEIAAKNDSLNELWQLMEGLQDKKSQFDDLNEEMQYVLDNSKALYPEEAVAKINKQDAEIRKKIIEFKDDFDFDEDISEKDFIEKVTEIKNALKGLGTDLDNIIKVSQENARKQLKGIFDQYVKDLFGKLNFDKFKSPVLTKFEKQISAISTRTNLGLKLTDSEKEKVRRFLEPSTWFNPKTILKEDDARKIVKKRVELLNHSVNDILREAVEKAEKDVKDYTSSFKDFMSKEFEHQVNMIIEDLKSKIKDQESLETAKQEAEEKLVRINDFKEKLEAIVA